MTIKNHCLLPIISDLIDTLSKAKYFTKLDVCWRYNNVCIKEGDEFKAAFWTPYGLYEPLVIFFSLTNSPATFQMMMNDIFHIEINNGFVLIYLDNILIFSPDLDTHHCQVQEILQKCHNNWLYIKPKKCTFNAIEVKYLGVIISESNITIDPVKVGVIATWPEPQTKCDFQSFLGFCNFYCRFIKEYAVIAYPLHSLTGNAPFLWTDDHSQAFTTIKCHYNHSCPYNSHWWQPILTES